MNQAPSLDASRMGLGHWSFTQALRRGQWVQLRCELQLLPPLRRVPSYDAAASQPAFELRAPRLEHGDRTRWAAVNVATQVSLFSNAAAQRRPH